MSSDLATLATKVNKILKDSYGRHTRGSASLMDLFQQEINQAVQEERERIIERGKLYLEQHEQDTKPWNTYTGKELKRILNESLDELSQLYGVRFVYTDKEDKLGDA